MIVLSFGCGAERTVKVKENRAEVDLFGSLKQHANGVRPIRFCTASMYHLSCSAEDKPTQAMSKKARRSSSTFATGLEETGELSPRRPRLRGMGKPASLFRGGAQVGVRQDLLGQSSNSVYS